MPKLHEDSVKEALVDLMHFTATFYQLPLTTTNIQYIFNKYPNFLDLIHSTLIPHMINMAQRAIKLSSGDLAEYESSSLMIKDSSILIAQQSQGFSEELINRSIDRIVNRVQECLIRIHSMGFNAESSDLDLYLDYQSTLNLGPSLDTGSGSSIDEPPQSRSIFAELEKELRTYPLQNSQLQKEHVIERGFTHQENIDMSRAVSSTVEPLPTGTSVLQSIENNLKTNAVGNPLLTQYVMQRSAGLDEGLILEKEKRQQLTTEDKAIDIPRR